MTSSIWTLCLFENGVLFTLLFADALMHRLLWDRFHLMFHPFNHKNHKNQINHSSDKNLIQYLGKYVFFLTSFFIYCLVRRWFIKLKFQKLSNFQVSKKAKFSPFDHFRGLFCPNFFRFPESKEIWTNNIRYRLFLTSDLMLLFT
jgi:hypothetical protein